MLRINLFFLTIASIIFHSKHIITAADPLTAYNQQCNGVQFVFPVSNSTNPQMFNCVILADAAKDSFPFDLNHPIVQAAKIIPGYPSGQRVTSTISVTIPQTNTWWRSTGVFAWPGSTITVTVPSFMVTSNYKLQIGCHSDNLMRKDVFYRWPVVDMSVTITNTTFTFKTYAGGIIYLNVDRITDQQPATLMISGQIVSVPRFVLGQTSPTDWANMIASPMVPLVQIESQNMVVVFNSSQAHWVSNVTSLAIFYDNLFARYYELSGSPIRTYKQDITVDVQISVGWAHSGYPIMMDDGYNADGDDSWTRSLTVELLEVAKADRYASGPTQWGTHHEIGHNFQKYQWTSSDEGEVTNNIFSMYMGEIYPDGPYQFGSQDFGPYARARLTGDYAKLLFYVDLREAFGWEPFRQFFRVFENNSSITADTDTDVFDNWLKYFSQIVQRDISPLFTIYNKTTSAGAKSFTSQFRPWTPNYIIDCNTAALAKSPCMTVTYNVSKPEVCINLVAWVRINTSEALEITFQGVPAINGVGPVPLVSDASLNSATYYPDTRVLKLAPSARINPEDKRTWCFSAANQLVATNIADFHPNITEIYANITASMTNITAAFTNITARVIALATCDTVNVPERSLEGVVINY